RAAASARSPGPSGFSLLASLMASWMPYSRSSSESGLPGWYGAIASIPGASSERNSEGKVLRSADGTGIRSKAAIHGSLALEQREHARHLRRARVAVDVDEEDVLP